MLTFTLAVASDLKEQEPKRILVIYSYHEGLPWDMLKDDSIRATLASESTGAIELNVEHADRIRNPGDAYLNNFVERLRIKYRHLPPDVVVGMDDEATGILLEYGEELFPEAPLLLLAAASRASIGGSIKSNMIFLQWGVDIKGTVDLICGMLPQIRQIFIITGSSAGDRAGQQLARDQLRGYTEPIKINYLAETTRNDLLDKVARLPERSAILYVAFSRDSEGKNFIPLEVASDISEKANVPVFGVLDTYLGNGIVGGYLSSAEVYGRKFAEICLRILGGKSPADIGPEILPNTTMFDWRQLKRWGIYESDLPEGSIVRFRPPSLWETHRTLLIVGAVFTTVVVFVLAGLIVQLLRRRQAEVRLLAAEAKYRSVVENAIEAIVVAQDYKVVFWNDRAMELTGYSAEEFATTSFVDFIHPEDRSKLMREYEQRLSGEKRTSRYTIRFLTKDGRHRWVLIGSSQIDWEGQPASLAMISDITEQKDAEEKLRKAEQKYRTVANFNYDWEYWEAPDGRLLYVSPSCKRITGYRSSDFVDRPELIESIILPEDLALWEAHSHGEKMGEKSGFCRFRIRVKDGTARWIEHACLPVYDEQGNYAGTRASNREITELKNAEQEAREIRETLARVDRTSTLGELAGSIAHELNQPLTGILSNAQAGEMLLKQGDGNSTEIEEILTDIVADGKRSGDILRNLRSLFGKQKIEFKLMSINAMVKETLRFLNSEFVIQGSNINIDLSDTLPDVMGNKIQLQQVLINLINNANKAMHQSAKADRSISIITSRGSEGEVQVHVEDNGPGIDLERLKGIFEPLTTSKPEGLGMGLSISRSIIQAHGGRIWAENMPAGGARISFTLPAG